jgi:AraC-like DNA-binding protein
MTTPRVKQQHQPMADMMQRMRMDLGRDWAIADFSALLGLSSSQLHRRFSKVVGSTPMDWLRRERMNAAKRLLVQTDLPVSEVAVRCGYPDPLHFSREFRRLTGSSPTNFRGSRGT